MYYTITVADNCIKMISSLSRSLLRIIKNDWEWSKLLHKKIMAYIVGIELWDFCTAISCESP